MLQEFSKVKTKDLAEVFGIKPVTFRKAREDKLFYLSLFMEIEPDESGRSFNIGRIHHEFIKPPQKWEDQMYVVYEAVERELIKSCPINRKTLSLIDSEQVFDLKDVIDDDFKELFPNMYQDIGWSDGAEYYDAAIGQEIYRPIAEIKDVVMSLEEIKKIKCSDKLKEVYFDNYIKFFIGNEPNEIGAMGRRGAKEVYVRFDEKRDHYVKVKTQVISVPGFEDVILQPAEGTIKVLPFYIVGGEENEDGCWIIDAGY